MPLEAVKIPEDHSADQELSAADEAASMERVVTHALQLYSETVAQWKDAGELVFLELELAMSSLKWGLVALLLMSVAVIMTFTFLIVAAILLLANDGSAATIAISLCAGVTAVLSACLLFVLKSLSRKMKFSNFRGQFLDTNGESNQ